VGATLAVTILVAAEVLIFAVSVSIGVMRSKSSDNCSLASHRRLSLTSC
jgi:hypothetical protein